MKKIDWETFKKALAAADQTKRSLMSSEVIYECVVEELVKVKNQTSPKEIIILIGDFILGLRSEAEVKEELSSLGVPDVYNFFEHVTSNITQKNSDIKTEPGNLSSEITAAENELAAVAANHEVPGVGIRTMANDMQTAQSTTPTAPKYQPIYPTAPETIYTSNQADIFPTPQPAQNQDQKLPPRWDSERQ